MIDSIIKICCMCLLIAGLSGCCGNTIAECPNGNPVSFPKSNKCAIEAYKSEIKDFELTFKAAVKVTDKIQVGVDDLTIKNSTQEVKEKLGQERAYYVELVKASYLALVINPCQNSVRHYALLDSISKKQEEINNLVENLETVADEPQNIDIQTYNRAIDKFMIRTKKEEGQAVNSIVNSIDVYYEEHQEYPTDLGQLGVRDDILRLGQDKIKYEVKSGDEYVLDIKEDSKPEAKKIEVITGKRGQVRRVK